MIYLTTLLKDDFHNKTSVDIERNIEINKTLQECETALTTQFENIVYID